MKRIAIGLSLALAATPAMANEIAGTRVSGQGAVCSAGQGKAVEYNIGTRQETSYCYERVIIVVPQPTPEPTPEPISTPAPSPQPTTQPTAKPSSEPTNEPAPTPSTETSTVTIEPPVAWQAPEKSNVVVVNASTNEAVVREETVDEYMNRVIWSWNYWWNELLKWFASLNEK